VPVPTVGVVAHAGVENVADMANASTATVQSLCMAIRSFAGCHLTTTQAKLDKLAQVTGRTADDLVEDALVVGYLDEVAVLREVLDSRYDDLKSGRFRAIEAVVALLSKELVYVACTAPNHVASAIGGRADEGSLAMEWGG